MRRLRKLPKVDTNSLTYRVTGRKDTTMVDGVRMVFKKELMLKRIEAEGMIGLVGEVELAIMDNLDGQEVSSANWSRQVKGSPVYSCTGKDGKIYDVNENDCE